MTRRSLPHHSVSMLASTRAVPESPSPDESCPDADRRHSSQTVPRTVAIAGATATLMAMGALHAMGPDLRYEGRIQLAGILPSSTLPPSDSSALTPSTGAIAAAVATPVTLAQPNIAPPDIIDTARLAVSSDPAMARMVQATLKRQGLHISRSDLLNQLTARTTDQGWLELSYRDSNPARVQQVLEQVARWYTHQAPRCDIPACRDVPFIQSQIPTLTQRQQELKDAIASVDQSIQAKHVASSASSASSAQNSPTPAKTSADILQLQTQELTIQHREQARIANQLEEALEQGHTHLEELRTKMALRDVKSASERAFLSQVVPSYSALLEQWRVGDRQLVMAAAHMGTIDEGPALAERQQALQARIKTMLAEVTRRRVAKMPEPLWKLVMDNIKRHRYVEDWLYQVHHMQMLEHRRQVLDDLQTTIATQTQEWRELRQTRTQLHQELNTVNHTLATYQRKYAIAQQQVTQKMLAWQVVAPPEVVQQPPASTWSWSSRLTRLPTPIMTLGTP